MTDAEKKMAVALAGCTFVPGTATKRFAKDMAFRAEHGDEKPLTPKQTEYLQTAVIRFRRQIAPDVVALAKVGTDKTANAEVRGDAPLYGAASLSTDGFGGADNGERK